MKIKLTEDIKVEDILLQIESNMPEGFELEPFDVVDESTGQHAKVYFDITESGVKFRVREKSYNELKNLKEAFEVINDEDFKAKAKEKEQKAKEIEIKNEKHLNELSSLKETFETLSKERDENNKIERELKELKELYSNSEITLFEYNDRRRKLILSSGYLNN